MKHCCTEGELRAYLDGEVATGARATIAAHLEHCPSCTAQYREFSERAAWVSSVMSLSESGPLLPVRRSRPSRWPVVALALAAALAIAFLLLPKRQPVRHAPAVAHVTARLPVEGPVTAPVIVRPAVHRPAPSRPQVSSEEFLRLDDDPIETASIVRVSTGDGLQADLIVGPDGRAHAIRVVRNQ